MLVGASRSRYASYPSHPIPLCASVPLIILRPKSSVRVRLKYSLLVSFFCVVWFLTSAHSRTFLIACLSTLVGWNIFSSCFSTSGIRSAPDAMARFFIVARAVFVSCIVLSACVSKFAGLAGG